MNTAQQKWVVIKKAHGSKGIYKEVMTSPLSNEEAHSECTGMQISQMTDAVIDFYVVVDKGIAIGQDYK